MCSQIEDLSYRLLSCESPFSWVLPDIDKSITDQFLINLLQKSSYYKETYGFRLISFSLRLVLGFELWEKQGDIVSAKYQLHLCYKQLKQLLSSSDQLVSSIFIVLWHVTLTCKAWFCFKCKNAKKASKLLEMVPPLHSMSAVEQAGVCGIKGAVFSQYKPTGLKQALDYAVMARDMDPYQPEWHYLVAYCLGRLRTDNGEVSQQELEELEFACTLKSDAKYSALLASVYTDAGRFIEKNLHNTNVCLEPKIGMEQCWRYKQAAVSKFKEALLISGLQNPLLKADVAHGLLGLPFKSKREVEVIKELLEDVVKIIPENSKVLLDLGIYYEQYGGNIVKALEFLLNAHHLGNYEAFLYMLELKWKHKIRNNSLIQDITKAMERYQSNVQIAELSVYLGVTYLLINDDWTSAVQCFMEALRLDSTADCLETFRGYNLKSGRFNLLEVVTNQLRTMVKEEEYSDKNVFHMFLGKVIAINQKLFVKPIDVGLYRRFKEMQQ